MNKNKTESVRLARQAYAVAGTLIVTLFVAFNLASGVLL